MLTCLGVTGGFLLICGLGGFIMDLPCVRTRLDRLAHGLPMFWDWSEAQETDAAPDGQKLKEELL